MLYRLRLNIVGEGVYLVADTEILEKIGHIVNEILQARGENPPNVTDSTPLLGGELPIDSLDLACLVLRLDEETGRTPFKHGLIEFQTAGELARLYAQDETPSRAT